MILLEARIQDLFCASQPVTSKCSDTFFFGGGLLFQICFVSQAYREAKEKQVELNGSPTKARWNTVGLA